MRIDLPVMFSFTRVSRFRLSRQSNAFRSRYTGQRQLVTYPFAMWEFEGTLVDYDGPAARDIRAFLVKLRGQENSFRLPVPGYSKPSTGVVNNNARLSIAALARATTINVAYLNISTPILKAGDYFTINNELKIATTDLTSDATGNGLVSFEPPLRKGAPIDTRVIINNPYVLLNAASDDVADWDISAPVRHGVKIEAIESFDIVDIPPPGTELESSARYMLTEDNRRILLES